MHAKLLQMTEESVSAQWLSTLFMYVYSLFLLNIKAGIFKDFRVVLLQSKI